MDKNKINKILAEKMFSLKPGVDFFKNGKHEWYLDENGEIDMFAYQEDYHNGPVCKNCGYFYCEHCDENVNESCEKNIPEYTSKLGFWKVLEKLKEDYIVDIKVNNDSVDCRISSKFLDKDNFPIVILVEADSIPLAVCLAAVKSLDVKNV